MAEEDLVYSVDSNLALLELDRPEHENRLTRELLLALARRMREAEGDTAVAAVAITGRGEWFCAGAEMPGQGNGRTERLLDFGDAWLAVRDTVADLGKPVIVGVNGKAFAGGLALTALADLAIATVDATFGLPELQYGIFPMLVLAGVADQLPRKVLFDLVYRGRVLDAAEAQRLDLVNDVVPDGQALRGSLVAFAGRLGGANPVAVRLGRRAYHAMDGLSGRQRMQYARQVAANLLGTETAADLYERRLRPPST